MATRTIVTSQPDVECDVCARRLLRGEQPDVFLAAGRRRIVCELCAPRAAHEGWMRESDSHAMSLPPMRARRGRSLFDRLRQRQLSRGAQATGEVAPEQLIGAPRDAYELFDGYASASADAVAEATSGHGAASQGAAPAPPAQGPGEPDATTPFGVAPETHAAPAQPSSFVEQAVVVFNASEFPRRVAGVSRSLGAPEVTVRSAEHLDSVVRIVVAWELCWYRYEVDLSEPTVEVRAIAQGTELAELTREDRLANAHAGDAGALALLAAV